MKCWRCGGHMTKYGSYATCDHCGRSVAVNTGSRYSNRKAEDTPSLAESACFAGLASVFAMAVKKLDEKDDRVTSHSQHNNREKLSFSKKISRFFRWLFYSTIACVLVFIGIGLILFGKDKSPDATIPYTLVAITGLLIIWSGALVFWLKSKDGLSLSNILGSVILNLLCKVAGMFILFANIAFLNDYSIAIRAVIGVCLFLAGHVVYKKIRDS